MTGEVRLTRRRAIVLRELVRAGDRWVSAAELAVALGYPDAAWEERAAHSGTPLALHRVQAIVQHLRRQLGVDVIETRPGRRRGAGGYRLGARGWELLGPGVRAVVR